MTNISTSEQPIRPSTPPRQPLQDVTNTNAPRNQIFDTPRRRKNPATPSQRVVSKPWPRFGKHVPLSSIREVTRKIFGYEPMAWQMDIFEKMAEGRDTMAIAGTGYGKSLVFALAAIAAELSDMKGTMLVICPLKSLEKDQVRRFNMAEPVHLANGKQVKITAVVVNEDNCEKKIFTQLGQGAFRLCYASPECLLRNQDFKQLFRNEAFRKRLVAIAVDEAHLIEAWKDTFRKDYGELQVLKVNAGTEVPWTALTATCSTRTFEIIYTSLGMGGSRPFWGIDMGSNRPNLNLWVRPMEYPTTYMADLFAFVPRDPRRHEDFAKTIFYFKSRNFAQRGMELCQALIPAEYRQVMQLYTATGSEEQKDTITDEFKVGEARWIFATIALGVGLDVPDIENVVMYGQINLNDAFQEGGRAGRDSRMKAKWIWIVEPWVFEPPPRESEEDTAKSATKQEEKDIEKRQKMDQPARTYINRAQSEECMREFLCDHFRPKPNLPGFDWYTGPEEDEDEVDVEWVVKPQQIAKGKECGCAAACCRADPNVSTGVLTATDHTNIQHHLNKIAPAVQTMAAYASTVKSTPAERKDLREKLLAWRSTRWLEMEDTHPFLTEEWVITDNSIDRLVDNANIFLTADTIDSTLLATSVRWMTTPEKTASLIELLEQFRDARRSRDQRANEEHPPKRRNIQNLPLTDASRVTASTPTSTPATSFIGTLNFSSIRSKRSQRSQQSHPEPLATPLSTKSAWKIAGYGK